MKVERQRESQRRKRPIRTFLQEFRGKQPKNVKKQTTCGPSQPLNNAISSIQCLQVNPGYSLFRGVATRTRHVAIARPSRKPKSLHCTPQCWSVAGGNRCPSHPSQEPGNETLNGEYHQDIKMEETRMNRMRKINKLRWYPQQPQRFIFIFFVERGAKPSAGHTSAGFPCVKWPQNLLNLTWLCPKASQTFSRAFSRTFSGTLWNLTWLNLLRNLGEPDLARPQSLPDLLQNLL